MSAELHYSSGRLLTWIGLSAVMAVGLFWLASHGVDPDYHGRGSFWLQLLGPTGTLLLFGACGLACGFVSVVYLRLLAAGDRLAARADRDGVELVTAYRRHRLPWREVALVAVQDVSAGPRTITMLRVERRDGGRSLALPLTTMQGGAAAARDWAGAAERLRATAR